MNPNEKRVIILAVGIIALQNAIAAGGHRDNVIQLMQDRIKRSQIEYNKLIMSMDTQELIRKLEAL